MKKLNFIIGALGGTLGGFLLSNPTLRKKLANAKDANEAAKILGRELQKSGKKVAEEAKSLVERDEVQEKLDEWKDYFVGEGEKLRKKAATTARSTAKKAKKEAGKAVKRVRAKVGR